jgi:hypothetical protein
MRKLHALWIAVCLGACVTYREDLDRGQRFYEENHYDRALATWRALEPDLDALEYADQSRYAYLRGMTDYRLGLRRHARHWLGLASAIDQRHPGGLTEEWRARLKEALAELNAEVWKEASRTFQMQPPPAPPEADEEGSPPPG